MGGRCLRSSELLWGGSNNEIAIDEVEDTTKATMTMNPSIISSEKEQLSKGIIKPV